MFTVLIAEKEHIDAIRQENRLFFEPFLDNKELAFCVWNPAGQNLSDSVPGLMDAVSRRKTWRAVIVNCNNEESIKTRNPFDVVDFSSLAGLTEPMRQPKEGENLDSWEAEWKRYFDEGSKEKKNIFLSAMQNPLQKLSTWLCFQPEDYILNEVSEKQDASDWALDQILEEDRKPNPNLRLEILERNQYKTEMRIKEGLRRAFVADHHLNISYPTEVHCISIRTTEKSFFDPDHYWNLRGEGDYSAFVDRNMYFDKMRFMVFDLLPRTHRNYRTDYIRFLASLLIFASNPVPASAMQARKLYQLQAETDDTPLCTLVTSYDRKLAATSEVIDAEMEQIRGEIPGELTDKDAEAMFCTQKEVPVLLDESCHPHKVLAENDYGLFFDSPENEFHKWNRSYKASQSELAYIAKQRSRAIRKSVTRARLTGEVVDVNINRLTPLQIDDVREYTDNAENEMVSSIPPDLTDVSRYSAKLEKESENIKKVLKRRMTQKATLGLSAVCLGLYFICFLPFLFSNNHTTRTVTTAVVFIGIMLACLAAVMVAALFFMRTTVRDAVKSYNSTARGILNDIQGAMNSFSKYLSASGNVRRGHAIQNYAQHNLDEYTMALRIRKKHQEDIRKKRAYLLEDYRDYFGDRSFCDETMARPYDYDFDIRTEYAYPAPFLAGDCRQIEFMSSGNYVSVPSSYVKSISVRMEGIYDR